MSALVGRRGLGLSSLLLAVGNGHLVLLDSEPNEVNRYLSLLLCLLALLLSVRHAVLSLELVRLLGHRLTHQVAHLPSHHIHTAHAHHHALRVEALRGVLSGGCGVLLLVDHRHLGRLRRRHLLLPLGVQVLRWVERVELLLRLREYELVALLVLVTLDALLLVLLESRSLLVLLLLAGTSLGALRLFVDILGGRVVASRELLGLRAPAENLLQSLVGDDALLVLLLLELRLALRRGHASAAV